jgi:hypothetical protein
MGYVACVSDAERWAWDFWVENLPQSPQDGCRLQAPASTETHNQCFQQMQEDMSKVHSACKDWDFVTKSTEISVGRFLIKYFTPLSRWMINIRGLSRKRSVR